jgi:signal transduction histidine kinase
MDPELDARAEERDDPRVLWPLLALFWTGNVGATMAQVYVSQRLGGSSPGLLDLLRWVLPGYVVWLVGIPVIVFVLARRFRFERGRWRTSAPVHLLASLAIGAATLAVDAMFALGRHPEREFVDTLVELARTWMSWVVFTYWFFLAFLLAIRHNVTAAARKLRASRLHLHATQLEAALAGAQLGALKTQLHPHFLFNALNSISSLVAEEPRTAQKMISQLGELLRATLAEEGGREWTLGRELEMLERYTAIEEMRFGDRLTVEVECRPEVLEACVPALLLQPLVENAIRHGIQPAMHGGRVRVSARRDGRWLQVEVTDDGVGLPAGFAERPAGRVGLSNTRERLAKQFPGEQSFSISRREPSGTRVRIRIPWSTAPAAAELDARPR